MGRTLRGMLVCGTATLALAAPAAADEAIQAEPGNRFTPTDITIDPGEKLVFHNHDVVMHDVTSTQPGSDGKPLFSSGFVDAGASREVARVPDLQPGSYPFLCTLHPEQMKGTLTVTGTPAPTPSPTPTPSPEPDTEAPLVTMAGTFRARTIRRKGRIVLAVRSDEPARLELTARIRKHVLGSEEVELPEGRRRVVVRLGHHARRQVRRGRRLRVIAVATDPAGNRRRSVLKVRLP